MDAGAIRCGEAVPCQAVQPALVCFPAAQRADVRCGRAQGPVERRIVELGIVRVKVTSVVRRSAVISPRARSGERVSTLEPAKALAIGKRAARIR